MAEDDAGDRTPAEREAMKRRAGEHAASMVDDGMVVGLGTGSTAAAAIRELGRRAAEGLDIRGIPTSYQSRALAIESGVPLTSLDAVDAVDLAIDGADQVVFGGGQGERAGLFEDEHAVLVKGGGAAHAREKVLAATAGRFVVVVDETKLSDVLDHPLPIEVLPDARPVVAARVAGLGGEPTLRESSGKDGPVVTDNGNLVIDADFGTIDEPGPLGRELSRTPGVLEHGLFVELTDEVLVGTADGVEEMG